MTSGRYLAVSADNQVITVYRAKADEKSTAFLLMQTKVDNSTFPTIKCLLLLRYAISVMIN